MAAGLLLRQVDGEKRVLMIGAHPDDEDTALLATFARGMGARTAYLSLTRGEGGQNLIGPELDEGLGIVRTGELEAARRLDGAAQYFTRAFDFGFSRTADESFGYWPREEVLRDVVEVIRRFRPHLVVSVFSGTPRDGHGHHQVAGILATEGFRAAGDPDRFPELQSLGVEPWRPSRLYQLFRGLPGAGEVPVSTGTVDPLLGRSHFQVAMESRSQHRSQDMGVPRSPGPRTSTLVLVEPERPGGSPDAGPFAGIDTTLVGLAAPVPGAEGAVLRERLQGYRERLSEAGRSLGVMEPWRAVPPLAAALEELEAAERILGGLPGEAPPGLAEALSFRLQRGREALMAAAGISLEVRVDRPLAVPGETLGVEVLVWNGSPFPVEVGTLDLVRDALPEGWEVGEAVGVAEPDDGSGGFFGSPAPAGEGPGALPPGSLRRARFQVGIPGDAAPSRLYFLREEREGEMYRWPWDARLRGLPRDPPQLRGTAAMTVRVTVDGSPGRPVSLAPVAAGRYVGVDKALGEFEEPLLVVPSLSVAVDPSVLAWPLGDPDPRTVTVSVRGTGSAAAGGEVVLEAPSGWSVEPARHLLEPVEGVGRRSFSFRVHPPALPSEGTVTLRAVARSGGREYREGFELVDYPHIERAALFRPAEVRVPVFPVQVAEGLRVGYVMGSGDGGAEALRQVGARVELLGAAEVQEGSLDRFDVLVLGVRVYEVHPELFSAREVLLDFARRGGTVVVQYNKYEYPEGGAAPWPVAMARPHDRVTDEEAPVVFLEPDSPLFTTPNRIGPADFDGWVQERGLYFLSEWDDRFVPLLEMADPGHPPTRGGLLVAPVGEGLYVYTGLAFFRQFPAGVPGAFRLLANLASLRGDAWPRRASPPEDSR